MAYEGYLVKVGNYTVPNSLIELESYQIIPDQRQDLDSYRDSNGKLHRTVVSNKPSSIKFNTIMLRRTQQIEFVNGLTTNFTNTAERKASVKFYNPITDSYETKYMYFPDITFTIYSADSTDILYKQTEIQAIGY